jgi:hypothetical protein
MNGIWEDPDAFCHPPFRTRMERSPPSMTGAYSVIDPSELLSNTRYAVVQGTSFDAVMWACAQSAPLLNPN